MILLDMNIVPIVLAVGVVYLIVVPLCQAVCFKKIYWCAGPSSHWGQTPMHVLLPPGDCLGNPYRFVFRLTLTLRNEGQWGFMGYVCSSSFSV